MDYETLLVKLKDMMTGLSPQLQRAAVTIEARADDVALLSMRELAARADLSPSTYTRLARALGFDDYAALREVVVRRIRNRGQRGFSRQAQQYATPGGKGGMAGRAHGLQQSIAHNLQQAFSDNNIGGIGQAAELLHAASRVRLLGARSCASLTGFFAYASQIFSDKVTPNAGMGDTLLDGLRYVKKGDVVLVAMFEPYTKVAGSGLRKAHAAGAKIILLTDSKLAPNSALATVHLVAPVETASFFHSLTAPLAVLDALLLAWLQLEGKSGLTQIEKTDRQLSDDGVYIRSRKPRTGARA
jgi:DNA-binding MurR/RpiR family transcriptional regulator